MRILPEKYKKLASRAGRYPKLRMELYAGTRGAWTNTVEAEYNGENAIISATYTNGITTKPSRFETGLAFCGSAELVLSGGAYAALTAGKRFKLFAGFYDPETEETAEAPVGEFFIESVSVDNGKTTVKARDKMMFAEQRFKAVDMTYPCSLLDCVREIFRQMGFSMPEDYELAINPTVVAPAWQKPDMTEGIYDVRGGDGYFFIKNPKGYDIRMPGEETTTKGFYYSALGYALTCREALASVAKMQLGNCFIDGDGIPRFSSYESAPPLGDDRITGLSVGDESFRINQVLLNYKGYDAESTALYKRAITEWKGEILYYTNFPSELPATLEPVQSRVVGKTFFEGTVEKKGDGETEIGDFIDYAGKIGKRRFFVFGLQYEWNGASFDETIYSFAPDYSGVDYEWLNDRDLVSDEDKAEEPVEEEEPETPEPAAGGVNIAQAVVIKEADAKYLLHDFTEIEYIAGIQFGYAGPKNQTIVQGYLAYENSAFNANDNGYGGSWSKESDIPAALQRYTAISGRFYLYHFGKIARSVYLSFASTNESNLDTYNLIAAFEDGSTETLASFSNYSHWSGVSLAIQRSRILSPGTTGYNDMFLENGGIAGYIYRIYKSSSSSWARTRSVTTSSGKDTWIYMPFSSLAEYQAAVGLTYEPLTLTRVEDNPTVV